MLYAGIHSGCSYFSQRILCFVNSSHVTFSEIPRKRRRTDSDSSNKDMVMKPYTHEEQPSTSAESVNSLNSPRGAPAEDSESKDMISQSAQVSDEPDLKDSDTLQGNDGSDKESELKPAKSGVNEDSIPKSSTDSSPTGHKTATFDAKADEPGTSKVIAGCSGRTPVREKPGFVDLVVKHIEHIFAIRKK